MIILITSVLVLQVCYGSKYAYTARLHNDLFSGYNKDIMFPGYGNVTLGLSITDIVGIDDDLITFNVWQKMLWRDYRLQWSIPLYGNVTTLHIPTDKIWTPDIVLYNQARKEETLVKALSVVYHDGNVIYIPIKLITVRCPLDGRKKEYHCHFKYASWTYDGFDINIDFMSDEKIIDFSDYSGKYRIVGNSGKLDEANYPCCGQPYPYIVFTLKILKD
ncbi:DgyrCDS14572 [Dimorphilus gyrociliatus]|uniref:DgyrCDS14572 n=1 Tax=Dimorphilus gyrociliatus TaxID=2664684 RepID=A0A7I8WE84_9ANNE|nr:DgyrCDS14572 [Dimorphilus gyrociliatus]